MLQTPRTLSQRCSSTSVCAGWRHSKSRCRTFYISMYTYHTFHAHKHTCLKTSMHVCFAHLSIISFRINRLVLLLHTAWMSPCLKKPLYSRSCITYDEYVSPLFLSTCETQKRVITLVTAGSSCVTYEEWNSLTYCETLREQNPCKWVSRFCSLSSFWFRWSINLTDFNRIPAKLKPYLSLLKEPNIHMVQVKKWFAYMTWFGEYTQNLIISNSRSLWTWFIRPG